MLDQVVALREEDVGCEVVGVDERPPLSAPLQDHAGVVGPARNAANRLLKIVALQWFETLDIENGVVKQDPHDAVSDPAAPLIFTAAWRPGRG